MKKRIIILVMSILVLFGCNFEKKFKEDYKIIYYNINEFWVFEIKVNIRMMEVYSIMKEFVDKNKMFYKLDLFFVIDDYYVFIILINFKILKVFIGGIWINSKIGIVMYVKDGVFLEIFIFMKKIVWE